MAVLWQASFETSRLPERSPFSGHEGCSLGHCCFLLLHQHSLPLRLPSCVPPSVPPGPPHLPHVPKHHEHTASSQKLVGSGRGVTVPCSWWVKGSLHQPGPRVLQLSGFLLLCRCPCWSLLPWAAFISPSTLSFQSLPSIPSTCPQLPFHWLAVPNSKFLSPFFADGLPLLGVTFPTRVTYM